MSVVSAHGDPPPADAIDSAVQALVTGQVVVIPTDTVYGLAVEASQPGAIERIFAMKQRPTHLALPVLVASIEQALGLAAEGLAPVARRLMERFWPGGLTLVVSRRRGFDQDVDLVDARTDGATVGLRLPAHPVPVALAARVGPLATTSANLHGLATPPSAQGVVEQLGGRPQLVLDAGACGGWPSTVVSCLDGEVRVLREGVIPAAEVLAQ
ncbi:MAG: L-threonylcarbamoyladenylate synthase [Acidimicrobiales bacterium]